MVSFVFAGEVIHTRTARAKSALADTKMHLKNRRSFCAKESINKFELREGLHAIGMSTSSKRFRELRRVFDSDNDSEIEFKGVVSLNRFRLNFTICLLYFSYFKSS